MVGDLLVALQTAVPDVQSVAPVWHSAFTPSVQELPGVQALQLPVLSHTPLAELLEQAVPMGSRLHIPVEHEWHVPQAVAQQIPDTHWPCVHWLFPEHGLPSPMVGVQAPPEPQ